MYTITPQSFKQQTSPFLQPGAELYLVEGNTLLRTPLRKYSDLQVGQQVAVSDGLGSYKVMQVAHEDLCGFFAKSPGFTVSLKFNSDDRRCWISGAIVDLQRLQDLF